MNVLQLNTHASGGEAYQTCVSRLVANSHRLAEIAGKGSITRACGAVRLIFPVIDTTVLELQHQKQIDV
jgi:hypothetical protein